MRSSALRKLDAKKPRSKRTTNLSDNLRHPPSNLNDIGGLWANVTITFPCAVLLKQPWVSSVHRYTINGMRQLQQKPLHTRKHCNQPIREPFSRIIRRRERRSNAFLEQERLEHKKDELHGCRNNARKFYQKIKRLIEELEVLRLWRKPFSTMLQSDGDTNKAFSDIIPNSIDDDGVESVKVTIMHLKNNNAAGLNGFPLNCLRLDAMS